jgi:hypothetical protein
MDELFSEDLDQKISESSQKIKKAIESIRSFREECRKTKTIVGDLNGRFKTSNPAAA